MMLSTSTNATQRPARHRRRALTVGARVLAAGALFAAGYLSAIAGAPYATALNDGLVQALDSVGKNLLGDAVFGAQPQDPMRIDVASDSRLAVALGVFVPPDPVTPCTRVAQLVAGGLNADGLPLPVRLYYDPALPLTVIPGSPPDPIQPNVARCGAVTTN